MIDEPTDGADEKYSSKTEDFVKLFVNCPSRVILSSTTLPSTSQLKPYVAYYMNKYHELSNPIKWWTYFFE